MRENWKFWLVSFACFVLTLVTWDLSVRIESLERRNLILQKLLCGQSAQGKSEFSDCFTPTQEFFAETSFIFEKGSV